MNKLKRIFSKLGTAFLIIMGILAVCGAIYGMYWVGKTSSYSLFYEDMVQETVREMVKLEALK